MVCSTQLQNLFAYTQQWHAQPKQEVEKLTQWFYLLCWIIVPAHLPRKFSDFLMPQISFPVILSFDLNEIRFWPVLSDGCIKSLDSELAHTTWSCISLK